MDNCVQAYTTSELEALSFTCQPRGYILDNDPRLPVKYIFDDDVHGDDNMSGKERARAVFQSMFPQVSLCSLNSCRIVVGHACLPRD